MKLIKLKILVLTASILAVSACVQPKKENKIIIASASNMQFVMQELVTEFTQKSGIECELIIGSSGKLTAQIKEGAPYDLLIAANMKYPTEIYNSGLAKDEAKVYAHGNLVLWSMKEGINPSIDLLSNSVITHIALANPKTAPYGEASVEVLKYYDIYDTIQEKLVYGESIGQTNQFITSKSVELGFTAMSVVLSPKLKGKGNWIELDTATYTPIEQGIVVIDRENSELAQKFYSFLFSEEAKKTLKDFGYLVNE